MNIQTIIDIKVRPKSSHQKIIIEDDGSIRVFLTSPPIDGKANNECIKLFSSCLGLAKSYISIDKGHHGRNKRITISGMNKKTIIEKIRNQFQ